MKFLVKKTAYYRSSGGETHPCARSETMACSLCEPSVTGVSIRILTVMKVPAYQREDISEEPRKYRDVRLTLIVLKQPQATD